MKRSAALLLSFLLLMQAVEVPADDLRVGYWLIDFWQRPSERTDCRKEYRRDDHNLLTVMQELDADCWILDGGWHDPKRRFGVYSSFMSDSLDVFKQELEGWEYDISPISKQKYAIAVLWNDAKWELSSEKMALPNANKLKPFMLTQRQSRDSVFLIPINLAYGTRKELGTRYAEMQTALGAVASASAESGSHPLSQISQVAMIGSFHFANEREERLILQRYPGYNILFPDSRTDLMFGYPYTAACVSKAVTGAQVETIKVSGDECGDWALAHSIRTPIVLTISLSD